MTLQEYISLPVEKQIELINIYGKSCHSYGEFVGGAAEYDYGEEDEPMPNGPIAFENYIELVYIKDGDFYMTNEESGDYKL